MVKGDLGTASTLIFCTVKGGEEISGVYPNIPEAFVSRSTPNTGDWQLVEMELDLEEIRSLGQVDPNENLGIFWLMGNAFGSQQPIYMDEIRVGPADAVFETASYEPAVGLTSRTDARYRSNFYEYDDLGRVTLTRDNDRNILRQYDYYDRNRHLNSQWIIGQISGVAPNLTFTAQQSAGYGDYDKTFHWDFGDGASHSGTNTTVSHFFDAPATYRVKLTVKDNKGNIVGIPNEVSVNTQ